MKQPQIPLYIVYSPYGDPLLDTINESEEESKQILCRRMYNNEVFSADWEYWESKGATIHKVEIKITALK
jgi:hypothetical protein